MSETDTFGFGFRIIVMVMGMGGDVETTMMMAKMTMIMTMIVMVMAKGEGLMWRCVSREDLLGSRISNTETQGHFMPMSITVLTQDLKIKRIVGTHTSKRKISGTAMGEMVQLCTRSVIRSIGNWITRRQT